MNVPVVVQIARMMTTHIATDGPEIHSQTDLPSTSPWAHDGLSSTPTALKKMWNSPRESLNHAGPWIPKISRTALTAPELANRKRNTTLIAIELVTEGK